jgi:hypothetical protein
VTSIVEPLGFAITTTVELRTTLLVDTAFALVARSRHALVGVSVALCKARAKQAAATELQLEAGEPARSFAYRGNTQAAPASERYHTVHGQGMGS